MRPLPLARTALFRFVIPALGLALAACTDPILRDDVFGEQRGPGGATHDGGGPLDGGDRAQVGDPDAPSMEGTLDAGRPYGQRDAQVPDAAQSLDAMVHDGPLSDAGSDGSFARDAGPDAGNAIHDAGERDSGVEDPDPPKEPLATRVKGHVSMAGDYMRADGSRIVHPLGRIPHASDPSWFVPNLYLCAIDRDGELDADPFLGDDDVLGCSRADKDGNFDIAIGAYGEDAGRELYLVTWFCDNPDEPIDVLGGARIAASATACVRFNAQKGSPLRRKFLHSREQALLDDRTNYLNWNLSCPAALGSQTDVQEVACNETEREETALTGSSNRGTTHSSSAWNKEFTHVFRSAAQASSKITSLRPRLDVVAGSGCGADHQAACTPCDRPECQSAVEFVIAAAVPEGEHPVCDPHAAQGEALGFDVACVAHGKDGRDGTLNPWRPLHALGHLMLRRWLKSDLDVPDACGSVTWTSGNDESRATVEGYANMIPIVSWFSDGGDDIEYEGMSLVGTPGAAYNGTCGSGNTCNCTEGGLEGAGRITRFFVDLWDSGDTINIESTDLLRVWSTFDQEDEVLECAPDGRNMRDFRDHYALIAPGRGWPDITVYDALAAKNCVNRHTRGNTTCGPSAACVP